MPELIRDHFSKNNSSATITTERSPIGDTAPTQLSNPVRLLFLWLILLAVVSSQACASKKLTPSGPGTVTATLSPDSFPFIRKPARTGLLSLFTASLETIGAHGPLTMAPTGLTS